MKLGKVAILGDSYSTFEGFIPENYSCYYGAYPHHFGGVKSEKDTWWWRFVYENGGTLVFNDSYSGSTVCNTGRPGQPASATFLRRAALCFNGETPLDTIVVFGSTNDSWLECPHGGDACKKWDAYTEEELLCVRPAIAALLGFLRAHYPHARIIAVINTELHPEISDMWAKAANENGCIPVTLENIDKISGHPTDTGMIQIKNQIRDAVAKYEGQE